MLLHAASRSTEIDCNAKHLMRADDRHVKHILSDTRREQVTVTMRLPIRQSNRQFRGATRATTATLAPGTTLAKLHPRVVLLGHSRTFTALPLTPVPLTSLPLAALLTALSTLTALTTTACTADTKKPPQERPAPLVVVENVTIEDVPIEVRAPVDLTPFAQVEVSARTLGYLDALLVDRGDPVKKGQPLARVRPNDLADARDAARAAVNAARTQLANATQERDRLEKLSGTEAVTRQQIDLARSTYDAALAAVEVASAELKLTETRFGDTLLLSPIDGHVVARYRDPGALVGPGAPGAANMPGAGVLLLLAKTSPLKANSPIAERDIARVVEGQPVNLTLDALPDQTFHGTIARMSPALDPISRTRIAELHLPNTNQQLRSGMFGRARIIIDTHKNAITVPARAVLLSNRKASVYRLDGDTVHRIPVTLGADTRDRFEITAGLNPNDQIVTAGFDLIGDGMKVRPKRDLDPFTGNTLTGNTLPGKPATPTPQSAPAQPSSPQAGPADAAR